MDSEDLHKIHGMLLSGGKVLSKNDDVFDLVLKLNTIDHDSFIGHVFVVDFDIATGISTVTVDDTVIYPGRLLVALLEILVDAVGFSAELVKRVSGRLAAICKFNREHQNK